MYKIQLGTSCHNTEQESYQAPICVVSKIFSSQLKEVSVGQIWVNLNNSKSNNYNELKQIKYIYIHETNN